MRTSIRATQLRHDNRLGIDYSVASLQDDVRQLKNGLAELGSKVDRILALLER